MVLGLGAEMGEQGTYSGQIAFLQGPRQSRQLADLKRRYTLTVTRFSHSHHRRSTAGNTTLAEASSGAPYR